jgi:hypothetical protein
MREEVEIDGADAAFEHMKKDETQRRDHKDRGTECQPGNERALEFPPTVMVFAPGLHIH